MLSQLRAVSAKPKKPPARPQQQLKDINAAAAQPAAAMATADEGADVPDSPKASWMQLVKQKKQAKEDSLAHMIRIRHAVLIIQVCGLYLLLKLLVASNSTQLLLCSWTRD